MNFQDLPKEERIARRAFANRVYNLARRPEATFDGDTGLSLPSQRENLGRPPTPQRPSIFKSWSHVWQLCHRACDGEDVPPDIRAATDKYWGPIHERVMVQLVDERLAAAEPKPKVDPKVAKLAAAHVAVVRLTGLIREREAKLKALHTRLKRAKRSHAALQRNAAKRKGET